VTVAPIYKETDLSAPALAQARRAITLILSRHEPWPAFVLDHGWTVLAANDAGQRLVRVMLGEGRLARQREREAAAGGGVARGYGAQRGPM